MSRIVFLCCHLSGTGHLVRTLTLARAARARRHDVTVISGGRPLEHVDSSGLNIVQLPPLLVRDLDFKTLWTPDGTQADPGYLALRRQMIGTTVEAVRAEVLVTELYPFGRRNLADEYRHAIRRIQPRSPLPLAKIVCSVRDVPEPKPRRQAEVMDTLAQNYDAVIVHGDEGFLPLQRTWPTITPSVLDIHHTGYVAGRMPVAVARNPGVLVAVGGGALGRHLLETAAQAAGHSARPWLLLVGGADADQHAADLSARFRHANLTIEPARSDYRALMASADCSISLCGYNTAVELAQCRTPAILVPEESAGEQEQRIRAEHLANHPGFRLMQAEGLTPMALADAAETAASAPRHDPVRLLLDDGSRAVGVIEGMLDRRRTSR